jgi:hypothetical protein
VVDQNVFLVLLGLAAYSFVRIHWCYPPLKLLEFGALVLHFLMFRVGYVGSFVIRYLLTFYDEFFGYWNLLSIVHG